MGTWATNTSSHFLFLTFIPSALLLLFQYQSCCMSSSEAARPQPHPRPITVDSLRQRTSPSLLLLLLLSCPPTENCTLGPLLLAVMAGSWTSL